MAWFRKEKKKLVGHKRELPPDVWTKCDGCGEINVFEVVMDNNAYSNREFASTGVRSYQAGHVGGSVCGEDCSRDAFPPTDVEVVDDPVAAVVGHAGQ